MRFSLRPLGDFFTFTKGLGYLGKYLESSDVALVGLNSFEGGGGYKRGGEKEYSGPFKPEHIAKTGDLFISTTDITQDGRVLASPFLMPDLSESYRAVIFSGDIVKADQINEGLCPEFAYNVLRVKSFRQKAAYASTGSTVRRIPAEVLERLEVPVPSQETQKAINRLIGCFDSKIEANNLIAAATEELARTIFKSWFIDFDPVHAKARGEQPEGMDAETAALFPDLLEESGLGLIPVGWAPESLGKHLAPKKGKVITKAKTNPGVIPVVAGGLEPAYFHDTFNVIGPAVTISASGANAGFVRLYSEDIWASDCTYISRDETDSVFYWYVFLKLRQEEIWHMQQGGAQPHIYSSDLQRLEAAFPADSRLIMKFEAIVSPLFEVVAAKTAESKALSQLREALLPRLISGDLEIPEELLVD